MTDITQRIAEVLEKHHLRMDYNHPGWGNCYCGFSTGFNSEDDFDANWWEVHAAHVAEVLTRELQPDIEKVAQKIWQTYVVETVRALPAGMADKLAHAAVAAMGYPADTEEQK